MSNLKRSIAAVTIACLCSQWSLAQQSTNQIKLDVSVADPLMRADQKQTTFVKVGLTGFDLNADQERPPVNIALVIDKSGSMQGQKIEKAKRAAIAAIDRLRADDIVSVVVYHDGVQVILPATKMTEKETARAAIRTIQAGGSTALFAGVSKGAAEVRKFLDETRVNRVILLSDGRANVGPDSPSELGELGASLRKEKIAVTTLGLGLEYNEDLMTNLAVRSNGNHLFIENANDLMATFNHEFNDVLSVVAQEISIDVSIHEGIRPVRVLGHEADIHGQQVAIQLNQLYAQQERFILLEVEVPATATDTRREIAQVEVSYANMLTNTTESLTGTASVRFSGDIAECKSNKNADVAEKSVLLIANEQNRKATLLRDQGKMDEALEMLLSNYLYLGKNADKLESQVLLQQANLTGNQVSNLDAANWKKTRKLMLRDSAAVEQQAPGYAAYGGGYGGGYGSSDENGGYGGGGYGGYGGGESDYGDPNPFKSVHDPDKVVPANEKRIQQLNLLIANYQQTLDKMSKLMKPGSAQLNELEQEIELLKKKRDQVAKPDKSTPKTKRRTNRAGKGYGGY